MARFAALLDPVTGKVANSIVADARIDLAPSGLVIADVPPMNGGCPVSPGQTWATAQLYGKAQGALAGNFNYAGKTLVARPKNGVLTIITTGQSNNSNYCQDAFTPVNAQNIFEIDIANGGFYLGTNPLLGTSGTLSAVALRIADAIISNGRAQNVAIVPIAIAGSPLADWIPGGVHNYRIGIAAQVCAANGLTCDLVFQHQGETDASTGTDAATFTARQRAIVQSYRDAGVSAPFFVSLTTVNNNVSSATIRAAQTNALSDALGIFPGPDTDTLLGAGNRYDGTHFNQGGAIAFASLSVNAFNAYWKTH